MKAKHPTLFSNTYVILPALNESRRIAQVLTELKQFTSNIVVVDDGSHDDTQHQARKFTPHVLRHTVNLGKGAALKTGCEYVFSVLHGDSVVFMDSDAQHNPSEVLKFFAALESKNHFILGVRQMSENMPKLRVWANRFASYIVAWTFGMYIPDIPSGYKALTKQAYKQLRWKARRYDVELEIAVRAAKAKLPFCSIPISTIYHKTDKGMTFVEAARMILQVVEWRITL